LIGYLTACIFVMLCDMYFRNHRHAAVFLEERTPGKELKKVGEFLPPGQQLT